MFMFMFMFRILFFTTTIVNSLNCYTPKDIINQGLVSYQNKVYDIKKYDMHPGGQEILNPAIGKPLEYFFNMDIYNFHMDSIGTERDLQKIYIGNLYANCDMKNNTIIIQMVKNNSIFFKPHILYSIITFSLFIVLLISIIILNNSKLYLNSKINIYSDYILSEDITLFIIIYVLWWLILLILSFFYKDVLTRLGIWICLNISFTLLPITKSSIFIKFFKLSYNKLINIHKYISILTILSVIIKVIVAIINYNFDYLF